MEREGGGFGGLVQVQDGNRAEETRQLAGGGAAIGEGAIVAIIEKDEGELSGGVGRR